MHLTRRDVFATVCVGAGVVAAAIVAVGPGTEAATAVRVGTAVVLALGFAASASAVVPGFPVLLHGSKLYLVIASLVGLGALAAGVAALVGANASMLGLLVVATVILWLISTARHVRAGSGLGVPSGAGA
jgi:hypothetical protein